MQQLAVLLVFSITGAGRARAQDEPYVAPEEPPAPTPRTGLTSRDTRSLELMTADFGVGAVGADFGLGGGIRLLTIRWESFVWTLLDVSVMAGTADFANNPDNEDCSIGGAAAEECTYHSDTGLANIATRVYLPVYKGRAGERQMWYGLGIGVLADDAEAAEDTPQGNIPVVYSLSPSVDYVVHFTPDFNVGLTARLAVGTERFPSGRWPFMLMAGIRIGLTPFNAVRRALTVGAGEPPGY